VKESRNLIAYFSRKGNNYRDGSIVDLPIGNTEVAAKMIQALTGGAMFHIDTVKTYPSDYTKATEIAQQELSQNARPVLAGQVDSLDSYDVVFLGYPNWWGTMPMAVWTFLEAHDFAGKTILPFCKASRTSRNFAPAPASCGGSRSGAGACGRRRRPSPPG